MRLLPSPSAARLGASLPGRIPPSTSLGLNASSLNSPSHRSRHLLRGENVALTPKLRTYSSSSKPLPPHSAPWWPHSPISRFRIIQLHPQPTASHGHGQRRHNSNPPQLVNSFSGPMTEFILTLSRIARIMTAYIVGGATLLALAFEGGHMYLEYVDMKTDPAIALGSKGGHDPYGWQDEIEEEGWGGGTDSRLGWKARHAIRGAWMTTHYGAGTSPDLMFTGPGLGRSGNTGGMRATPSQSYRADAGNGLMMAEGLLTVALTEAEKRGIKLPEVAAVRLGLAAPHQAGTDKPLDTTAIILETRMADVRQRLGTPESTVLAIAGYERIFDALSAAAATQDAVADSGQPATPTSRLVRLATRLGDLNAYAGHREAAEGWLLKAISIAGGGSATATGTMPDGSVLQQVAAAVEGTGDDMDKGEGSSSSPSSSYWFTRWMHRSPTPAQEVPLPPAQTELPSTVAPIASANAPEPTPALTRSLASALLSLSGLYASPPSADVTSPRDARWRSNLEQALRVQASALRLLRLELQREHANATDATAAGAASRDSALHTLWLRHNEAVASLHLAETIFALNQGGSTSQAIKRVLSRVSSVFSSSSSSSSSAGKSSGTSQMNAAIPEEVLSASRHGPSIRWLLEAEQAADCVSDALAAVPAAAPPTPPKSKSKASKKADDKEPELKKDGGQAKLEEALQTKWRRPAVPGCVEVPAGRLLRDAGRVQAEADKMIHILLARK